MQIERIKLSELKPLDSNVRNHPEVQIKELARSVDQFGQTRAMVIDEDNNILIGNGLYYAMKYLGREEVDIHRIVGLSKKDKKKLILSDNKIYTLGRDDFEGIQAYIDEITASGDFDIAGFDEEILKEMTRTLDDVKMDVMNYGINEVTPVATPRPVEKPVEPKYEAYTPTETKPVEPVQPVQQVDTSRKIICPNCGEVIIID